MEKQILILTENVKIEVYQEQVSLTDANGKHNLPYGLCLIITDSEGHEVHISLTKRQAARVADKLTRKA